MGSWPTVTFQAKRNARIFAPDQSEVPSRLRPRIFNSGRTFLGIRWLLETDPVAHTSVVARVTTRIGVLRHTAKLP